MKRVQQKCFLVSVAIHGLLLVLLLVGPAFANRRSKPTVALPVLHVIPSTLVDELMSGGGNPRAHVPPATTAPLQPQPQPQPVIPTPVSAPTPRPAEPEPVREPDPPPTRRPEVRPAPPTQRVQESVATPERNPEATRLTPEAPRTPELAKPVIKVNTKLEQRGAARPDEPSAEEQERAAQRRRDLAARREREQRLASAREMERTIQGAVRGIQGKLSGETVVDIPGPGGAAYANYSQVVKSLYDQAWIHPTDVENDQASVRVEVIILRDGKVLSDRILGRSGIRALDQSVQDALNRVRAGGLPAFPAGAQDSQRVFKINFNLKSRRPFG